MKTLAPFLLLLASSPALAGNVGGGGPPSVAVQVEEILADVDAATLSKPGHLEFTVDPKDFQRIIDARKTGGLNVPLKKGSVGLVPSLFDFESNSLSVKAGAKVILLHSAEESAPEVTFAASENTIEE